MRIKPANNYRPDIDGLRAVAVLTVVLFHAGVTFLPGGYTGVDVFFVISGYLITSIIQRDIDSDTFSIYRFWERRVRRIAPPLVVVLLFTTIGAWMYLLPGEFREFSQSLAAQSVFMSNMFFWTKSGYFATAAELKPLQHTWSLAIEEQFYMLFPWLLVLLSKQLVRFRFFLLLALTLASLVLSHHSVLNSPTEAFYWLPYRAWELMLGSLLVYLPALSSQTKLPSVLSSIGLLLIVAACVFYSAETRFPGLNALAPCLGTAAIIYAHKDCNNTWIYSLLSWKPLVFIGLISYSLYLWHWPLFAFARNIASEALTKEACFIIIILSLILATASLWLVEKPIRSKRFLTSSRSLFTAAIATFLLFVGSGVIGHIANGFPQRLDSSVRKMATGFLYTNPRRYECLFTHRQNFAKKNICKVGANKSKANTNNIDFLVIGDSHANSLMPLIDRLAEENKTTGLYPVYNGCPPILNIYRSDVGNEHQCHSFNVSILEIIKTRNIKNVLLIGRWSFYALDGVIDQTDTLGRRPANWHHKAQLQVEKSKFLVSIGIQAFINELPSDTRISILQQIPEQMALVSPDYLAKRLQIGEDLTSFGIKLDNHLERQFFTDNLIVNLARQSEKITAINLTPYLCNQDICPAAKDGGSMYRDFNHISTYGSQFVAEGFKEFFNRVKIEEPSGSTWVIP